MCSERCRKRTTRKVRGREAFDPKPDGPRYAAMGDAVTVNVAEWLGRRILSAENGLRVAA